MRFFAVNISITNNLLRIYIAIECNLMQSKISHIQGVSIVPHGFYFPFSQQVFVEGCS